MPSEAAVEHMPRQAGEGLWEAGEELLDVLFDVIVPVIAVIAGFFITNFIGLSGAFLMLMENANLQGMGKLLPMVSGLVAAAIWGGVTMGMWRMQKGKHGPAKWILRPLAAFFGGLTIGEIVNAVTGTVGQGAQHLAKLAQEAVGAIEGGA